jgi:putative membrane-bound dehydrogenase-like protein
VRDVGKGRLFYTASGHDKRSWQTDGFFDLLLRAIVYTAGDSAQLREYPQFEYVAHDWVPNYEQRDPQDLMQVVSTPQQALESLVVPAGMHAELFACEPMIVNPIAMAWDEAGRCWVVESPGYPADRDGKDRIVILEDTDNDGRADKKTVFADGLNLPTSVLKVDGGVLVTQAPDLLFLKDSDGDDVCDAREVLFSGFGIWDTHAGPSNLRWGPDNYIWGAVGYSGYSNEQGSFGSGLWRWKPGMEHPDFMAQFSNNTWGLDFNSKGEIWGSTANNAPSFFVGIPQSRMALPVADSAAIHPAIKNIRQGDFFGKYTAASGFAFASGDQLPSWWNDVSAFICEPTAHLVGRQRVYSQGSGFRTEDRFNFAVSVDDWFCPVQAEVGPDGAMWIADFSQFIILHNLPGEPERGLPSVDYDAGNAHLNPLRDKSHGRIFRIVRDDLPAEIEFDLSEASADEILKALYSSNKFWRVTARRLLLERDMRGARGYLNSFVKKFLEKGPNGVLAARESLRVLDGFDEFENPNQQAYDTLRDAIIFNSGWLGETAIDVMPRNGKYALLLAETNMLSVTDKKLQRHAMLVASEMPPSYAIAIDLMKAAKTLDAKDPWMAKALKLAIRAHAKQFSDVAEIEDSGQSLAAVPTIKLPATSFKPQTYTGKGEFVDNGSELIISSTDGADCSFQIEQPVQESFRYRFSALVKTEAVMNQGKAHGVLLNVHPEYIVSESVAGDSAWSEISVEFETAIGQKSVTLNCLYGGWGESTGTAYYREMSLETLGPANGIDAFLDFADQQPAAELVGDAEAGKLVYESGIANCLGCHPGVGPNLAGISQRLTAAEIKKSIIDPSFSRAKGFEDNLAIMPEVTSFLSAQDVADLVAFIMTL